MFHFAYPYVLYVGSEQGAPVPLFDAQGTIVGHESVDAGKPALSKLNASFLAGITEELGGVYTPLSAGDQDITAIAEFVKAHEREQYAEQEVERRQDQFHWFALLAWVLYATAWFL